MPLYPALHIARTDPALALALLDDYGPTAAEDEGDALIVYFTDRDNRTRARQALAAAFPDAVVAEREVDDENWAERSQTALPHVQVGALMIRMALGTEIAGASPEEPADQPTAPTLVIRASMGFGTGHHATTRLCLAALQRIDLAGARVLDIGTGSGILALAAKRLGARTVVGIDSDPDAILSAERNLPLNPDVGDVRFEVASLEDASLPSASAVTANLTGAVLVRSADTLTRAIAPGGVLIVSGVLDSERDAVCAAYRSLDLFWEGREDEWVGLIFQKPAAGPGLAG